MVSGHPMDAWQKICEQWLGWSTERLKTVAIEKQQTKKATPVASEWGDDSYGHGRFKPAKTEVKLGGLLSEVKEITTKKGSRMAFAQLEDLKGKVEIVLFPETFTAVQEILKRAITEAEPVIVGGDVEFGEEAPKILVKTMEWAEEAHRGRAQQMVIHLNPTETTPDQLRELKKQLLQSRGKCPVRIDFANPEFRTQLDLPRTFGIAATPQTVQQINKIFGRDVVGIR